MSFLEVETSKKKSMLSHLMELLNERRSKRETTFTFQDESFQAKSEEKDVSTQFLHVQRNPLIELQDHFERYCTVLPVLGFNSGKSEINLIKRYFLPILVEDKNIEPNVIKTVNQYVSFKFGDVQLLDILNFLGGATN